MGYLNQIRRDIEYELFIFATEINGTEYYDTQMPPTLKGPSVCVTDACVTLSMDPPPGGAWTLLKRS